MKLKFQEKMVSESDGACKWAVFADFCAAAIGPREYRCLSHEAVLKKKKAESRKQKAGNGDGDVSFGEV